MENIFPVRIVAEHGVLNAENLLKHKTLQIGLSEVDQVFFDKNSYVILDYGKEYSGSLRFISFLTSGAGKIRVRLGESVSEVCHDIGEKNATNDHSARDWTFFVPNYSDQTFLNSGFRFARIDLLEDTTLNVKSIVCKSDMYEKEFDGSFRCSDERINEIFDVAAHTFRLCIHNDMIWDGVKRDRLVWIGDLHPEQMTADCLYENTDFIRNSISFAKDQTVLPKWMNNMPTYSLWWIINLRDYYFRTGDKKFVEQFGDYLVATLKQIDGCVKDNGETAFPFNFIDWPSHPKTPDETVKVHDEAAGVHALVYWCMNCTKELLSAIGRPCDIADSILVKLSKISYSVKQFKQISAIRLMAGIGDEKDVGLILKNGAEGLSTFMSYYLFRSISDKGYGKEAVSMMKEYYGKMLDLGATTFWEDFDIKWAENAGRIDEIPEKGKVDIHAEKGAFCYVGLRHSFCHGWSSGVVPFLMRYVAGIEEVGVGGKEIVVKPDLCGLGFVDVVYPLASGKVYIKIRNENGKTITEVKAPEGIKVTVL